MKIATYNVWNENKSFSGRQNQLLEAIRTVDADVIGLQEVTSDFYENYLAKKAGYPYSVYKGYHNEDEGLAILSKHPIPNSTFLHTADTGYCNALNAVVKLDDRIISFTTLHLPWDSALEKERQICVIDRWLHTHPCDAGLYILAGDFNGGINSSVHRYLVGDQSLNGQEANPSWDELATGWQALSGTPILPTLDTLTNPRWAGSRSAYPPTVMDRIYTLEMAYDIALEDHFLFGTNISPETGYAPSDHYGVAAEITLEQ